jgi:hypothetical protein
VSLENEVAEVKGQCSAGIEIEVYSRGDGPGSCVVRLPAALPMRQVAELVHAIAAARTISEVRA